MVFLRIQVLTFLPCRERQRIKECNRPFGCYQKKWEFLKAKYASVRHCVEQVACRLQTHIEKIQTRPKSTQDVEERNTNLKVGVDAVVVVA